jgi:hypothetical protein
MEPGAGRVRTALVLPCCRPYTERRSSWARVRAAALQIGPYAQRVEDYPPASPRVTVRASIPSVARNAPSDMTGKIPAFFQTGSMDDQS